MSITVNCVIDLTEEELLFVLRRRAGQIVMVAPPEETAAAASVGPILTPEQLADSAREEEELAAAHASIDGDYPVTEGIPPPPLPVGPTGLEGLGNLGQGPIDREQQAEIERKATGLTPPEPPPLPPKQPRGRASRVNGAAAGGEARSTPSASPPVNRLDEASMRALLSKVGAIHPLKVKAITNLLEAHGGHRRLSECDPATWPAIAEAARLVLAEYAP